MMGMTGIAGNATEKEKLHSALSVQECSIKDALVSLIVIYKGSSSAQFARYDLTDL